MKKVVFFDFDGVIADTYDIVYEICSSFGYEINDEIFKTIKKLI